MVETDEILAATKNRIFFEILMQEFDSLFYYKSQEGPKLNLININSIHREHVVSIYQKGHILSNTIQ